MPVDLCKEVICNALCMFNLDPSKICSPGTNFLDPSEKFVPTVGQPHKGKSVHGMQALMLSQRKPEKDAGPFACN